MKVKEIDRTANIAWSPAPQVPVYLAAGTAAQQLDATFSTSSSLEIYSLNLSETGHDLPCVASLAVEQRFHKLVWGSNGMADDKMPSGLLVGGSDRGVISMFDVDKLIKKEDSKVFCEDKHTGPVSALDFNPFQSNLLASGSSESEIYIWDVNKPGTAPMTPGPKSQPLDDVRCIAWNRQVQHILASSFASRTLVWDLRKNDPIIKISDSTSRMRCKVVAWHPDVATQMALASEDDHTPVIQIWDLRLASSPLKTLEGHTKGVLSLAWCKDDSDLLMSCGKDNRILVWNPNSPQGEIVAELPTSNQWSFDVSWCPRNPAIIASASFDGHVSMYSLMGGQQQVQPTNNRITDSFGPGLDTLPQQAPKVTMQLKSPPKWLRRPCGASFGFGGQLLSFENSQLTQTNQQGVSETVYRPALYVSRVVTEDELVQRSVKLETSLEAGNHEEFCSAKAAVLGEEEDEGRVWRFIGAAFTQDPANQYLNLLDINLAQVKERLENIVKPANQTPGLANDISSLSIVDQTTDDFEIIANTAAAGSSSGVPTSLDKPFGLDVSEEAPEGQLSLALLTGNMELAVDICVQQARWSDALILAAQAGGDLLVKTQALYFQRENNSGGSAALVEALVMNAWERLVANADLASWKEVLCAVIVYCDIQRRLQLAGVLGARLAAGGDRYKTASTLAYIVAADMEHVLDLWIKDNASPQQLQDMVEVVVILRASIETQGLSANLGADSRLAANLARYATLLASQGCLKSALSYLGDTSSNPQLQELKDRLEKAINAPVSTARAVGGRAASIGSGVGSQPGSRRPSQQPLERKVSGPGSQFNTGLPSAASNQYNSGGSTGQFNPGGQFNTGAVNSHYGGQYAPAPAYNPPSQAVPPMQPVAPMQSFQPPTDLPAPTGSVNPLLKRGRALDPSINTAQGNFNNYNNNNQNYGQGYNQPQPGYNHGQQEQTYQPGGNFSAPAPSFQPAPVPSFQGQGDNQPNILTPDPIQGRIRTLSTADGAAFPPSGMFQHTPDHGGPGHTPVVSSGSGWNDPPPSINAKTKPAPVEVSSSSWQQPITAPLYSSQGSGATEPVSAVPAAQGWAGFTPAPVYEPAAPPAPAPVAALEPELPPMPQQNKPIQDVLDLLTGRCQQAANHPQTRRKLEDVHKKLDILYSKLRRDALSGGTVQGLHQIIQFIQHYDYASCLQVISGLIAGGSFAELADFMPGIKVLLQVAQQNGVYIEQN